MIHLFTLPLHFVFHKKEKAFGAKILDNNKHPRLLYKGKKKEPKMPKVSIS